mgnify:CR=1 FL=1
MVTSMIHTCTVYEWTLAWHLPHAMLLICCKGWWGDNWAVPAGKKPTRGVKGSLFLNLMPWKDTRLTPFHTTCCGDTGTANLNALSKEVHQDQRPWSSRCQGVVPGDWDFLDHEARERLSTYYGPTSLPSLKVLTNKKLCWDAQEGPYFSKLSSTYSHKGFFSHTGFLYPKSMKPHQKLPKENLEGSILQFSSKRWTLNLPT